MFACAFDTLLSAAVLPAETNGLKQEVYVWQRTWNAAVRDSLAQHASSFSRLVALNAEVTWQAKRPQIIRVPIDWQALRAGRRPIGLALRIGAYPGPFDSNGKITTLLVEQAYTTALTILREKQDKLVAIAEHLIEVETIDGTELDTMLFAA